MFVWVLSQESDRGNTRGISILILILTMSMLFILRGSKRVPSLSSFSNVLPLSLWLKVIDQNLRDEQLAVLGDQLLPLKRKESSKKGKKKKKKIERMKISQRSESSEWLNDSRPFQARSGAFIFGALTPHETKRVMKLCLGDSLGFIISTTGYRHMIIEIERRRRQIPISLRSRIW